jgi:hypothetical protein
MIFIQIVVSGLGWERNKYANQFGLGDIKVWHTGNPFSFGRGRFHKDSGFAFSLIDQESWGNAQKSLRETLAKFSEIFKSIQSEDIISEINIGMTVGEPHSFVQSIDFEPDLLRLAYMDTARITSDLDA